MLNYYQSNDWKILIPFGFDTGLLNQIISK